MAENILERYVTERSPALRNQLVEANLGIAAAVARKFVGRGVDFDDLYQVASFALLKAIERYEPDRGVKLTSFVVPSMIGEIKNYFRDRSRSIRLPRRGSEGLARVEEARGRLHARLLREPTHAELAAEAGLEMDELIEFLEMRGAVLPASMDEAREDDIPLGETLGAADEGYARVENRDAAAAVVIGNRVSPPVIIGFAVPNADMLIVIFRQGGGNAAKTVIVGVTALDEHIAALSDLHTAFGETEYLQIPRRHPFTRVNEQTACRLGFPPLPPQHQAEHQHVLTVIKLHATI